MESLDRLLNVEDLANDLEVSVATIFGWRYCHDGPRGFHVGRYLRQRRSDVGQWSDRLKTKVL